MKKVFEYMGWHKRANCSERLNCSIPKSNCNSINCRDFRSKILLDGRDMVLAINAIKKNGDWDSYIFYTSTYYYSHNCLLFEDITFSIFGDPINFFKLMEEWLEKEDKI